MKMELTAKDIRLLKIMLTILTAVLMLRFLIFPAVEKHQTLRYEQEEAEQKQEEMQYVIDNKENSRSRLEKAEQELKTVSSPYYGMLEQRDIDELVTGLAYRYELFPSRLDMGQRMDNTLAPYIYSKSRQQKEEAQAEAAPDKEEQTAAAAQEEPKKTESYIKSTEAAITLVGPEERFLALLDDIEHNYPSVQVRSFEVSRRSYMNAAMHLTEETQSRLVLTVYMCDKEDSR